MPFSTHTAHMHRFACAVVAALLLCVLAASFANAVCQVPNCRTCAADNEFFCEVCTGPEFIHANGQCSPRGTCGITGCERCEEGTITRCQTCEPDYVRTTNGLCASLVVCDMDKCEPQEDLRSRIEHSAVKCNVGDEAKEDGVYVCVAAQSGSTFGTAGSHRTSVPWWCGAAVVSACAIGFGSWMVLHRHGKA